MTRRSVLKGTGASLPQKIVTNADMEKIVDTSDEWITQRSGIKARHIAGEGETTSSLATQAARQALENAGLSADDIDTIIVATTTPDHTFPSVAVQVQANLGIKPCPAFDVQAVCTGFVYALSVADSFIRCGQSSRVLVIGAETMSRIVNWDDRATCVLFGDGAGAFVLEADEGTRPGAAQIFSSFLYANGAQKDLLYTSGGPSTTGDAGYIIMQGREVFKYAVQYMADVVNEVLEKNNLTVDQIDWLVPHQANIRIIESTAKKLRLPMDKVVVTLDKHGNTSAASIPMAFHEARADGRIKCGDLVMIEGMGGGLTWGATLLRM